MRNNKADVLIEALPYFQRFRGQTFVVKYGGAAMENPDLVESVLRDIVFLEAVGINPVVVHGGGKAITAAMRQENLTARFVDGLRVTDQASMGIIDRVLAKVIGPSLVAKIEAMGGRAELVSGKNVLRARKAAPHLTATGEKIDLGFVGDITEVNGVRRDPKDENSLIYTLTAVQIEQLKEEGIIAGGMLPKVNSALKALAHGVEKVHFLDGRQPQALLLELFTDGGIGTAITNGKAQP
jgi:acetylglutamate kinase